MFQNTPFVWGSSGEALTPAQVARKRELAELARERGIDTSPIGHWTQGAARVVDALGGVLSEKRADRAEAEGMASADDFIANSPVLSSLIGSGGSGVSVGMPGNAMSGGSAPSIPVGADSIRAGLMERGLPEHIADAFILNFQDESGLNPGINEANPIVPGSRGGYGLYQLTGPRRVAYEKFAQQRGVDPSDVDAQLDFLMYELQGPESAAAQSILSAPDTGSAAAAIVNKFLRPAEEHRAARASRYLGGAQAPTGGMPQQNNAGVIAALSAGMSNPWVAKKYGPVMEALMGQQMRRGDMAYQAQLRQQDPMYQAQLAQLTAPEQPKPIEVGGVLLDPVTREVLFDSRQGQGQGGFTLSPGQTRFDAQGNALANVPEAPEDPDVPTTKNVTLSDGSEVMVQWNPQTQVWDAAPIPKGGTTGSGGPVELTESQARMTLFRSMQDETQPILNQMEEVYNPANIRDAAARNTPLAGNFYQTPEGQQYKSAASAWAEGALRLATGAAATPEEFTRTISTYFAQPGDTPETIQFKARMRDMYSRSIQRALGERPEGQLSLPTPAEFAEEAQGGVPQGGAMDIPPAPDWMDAERWPQVWEAMPEEDKRLWQ